MIHLIIVHSIVCSVFLPAATKTAFHVYPDDYIDRSVSVVIRDDIARVEYSVAMNDSTIRKLLHQWGETKDEDQNSGLHPFDNKSSELPSNVKQSTDESPSIETDATDSDASEDEFSNDAELVAEFRKEVAKRVASELAINCQQQPITIGDEIDANLPPRYHTTATMKFEFRLPPGKALDLSIADSNFSEYGGCIRCALKFTLADCVYALKVGGKLVLTKSNVAPVLVRAKRIEFEGLTNERREKASRIEVQVVRVASPKQ